ncbi:LLM class flavin-dependent oxidoreductase [Flexivirga oryzae]|uniref:Alkanesulfonate monooxygenase SsuD/methylene tetrahydromethanopterin reductase-like flavin-dependent oxidoreductase (Luciferase family) n=1 Tax=Flexivirga oryzae TaxID=1794944 RepID=A0A839NBV3_9MICO|nr:LLM class flavin-dependent oxidoreductase [Flexivirga oryzae]MBB2894339.1 alkanesulfonate monooxygenase SsuD/methylene tetrahydromethanopterin reductase-like flavin-dependent oxidoreductase (luciferase family) [Flexivirga oryzae]
MTGAARNSRAVPLSVLDLVHVSSGSTAREALHNSVDLARRAEEFGYARYWFAEHHLNPGVVGVSPALTIALAAAATNEIRVGAAAVQMGHRSALSTVEEFGLLDAAHPGRIDLGLGRSGGRPPADGAPARTRTQVLPGGLVLPPPFPVAQLVGSPRFALQRELLGGPDHTPQPYDEQVADLLALLESTYRHPNGEQAHVATGEDSDLQVWIHGSSAGDSARLAAEHGLRFGANYHVAPAHVVDAVTAYREQFRPSASLARPHVIVSADVVVAETTDVARELATGYGPWVRSIRTGAGAIPFPTPDKARALPWSASDNDLVVDRITTQFVGTAAEVADKLQVLQQTTDADELLVTTITHDHDDRVRSFQLLAKEWQQR